MSRVLGERVLQVKVEEEMKHSYLDYAMSVIVGRALPDARDGLKPVHRRILFGMYDMGNMPDRPYKKSARVVGDVLGKYHPHGEGAVYDALVRLAQDFSSRYPLVDGHGNFGSLDGDEPAAMRYTEVRLSRLAVELLTDLDRETVDYISNFDGTLQEPVVLPSAVPNLMINGSSGIAVGMATNFPPHNLGEVVDGLVYLIEHPGASSEELLSLIPGPDFPTGGIIMGREGVRQTYLTGKGAIILRGRLQLEELKGGREQLVITEIPYQVNKAALVEKIAELVRNRKIHGIADIRDESDRRGMRVVLELKREAKPFTIINQLYKHTALQISYGAMLLALVDGTPRWLDLSGSLEVFLRHRQQVVERRTRFELGKSRGRQHILLGFQIALDHIDEVVALIRKAQTVEEAKRGLMDSFALSEVQAQAILDMRLSRLTGLERSKVEEELQEITRYIAYLESLLADPQKIMQVIKDELLAIKEKFSDARRTVFEEKVEEISAEDLIPEEKVVVSITADGYFKRIPMSSYRSQKRGGVGVMGMTLRKEDVVEEVFVCSTHQRVLFFTNQGRVCGVQAYEIPEGTRADRGSPVRAFFSLNEDESISTAIPIPKSEPEDFLVFATKSGLLKKTPLLAFKNAGKRGIKAISLDGEDSLASVRRTNHEDYLLALTAFGFAAHFRASDLRPLGREARGVRGIRLRQGDRVVGLEVPHTGCSLLLVSERGYGKRLDPASIPVHKRGGKGVIVFRSLQKKGKVVASRIVYPEDDVIFVTMNGKIIRIQAKEISCQSRMASGVHLVRLEEQDLVVAVARVSKSGTGMKTEEQAPLLP